MYTLFDAFTHMDKVTSPDLVPMEETNVALNQLLILDDHPIVQTTKPTLEEAQAPPHGRPTIDTFNLQEKVLLLFLFPVNLIIIM